MTASATQSADKLNELAAATAASEARQIAEKQQNKFNAALEDERERVAGAETERDAAMEVSVTDESVTIPNIDRRALELAEKKAAAAQRAAESACEAETAALQLLTGASKAFECAAGLQAMEKLQAELAKLKSLIDLISLQHAPRVNEALFAANFRISRSYADHRLTLEFTGPAKVPTLTETCSAALGEVHQAARKFYGQALEREHAAATRERDLRIAEMEQR